jgi:N-acyl-D-aspartate/D-glutamate deacylase
VHDLVIHNAMIVDGTGAPAFRGDLSVRGGLIAEVGKVDTRGRREIDADGLVLAPGWVDIHTHYDGQASWDRLLAPTSLHGVTTAVIGNCGVGFAPVAPGLRDYLIELMEGVEDIPGTSLHEGIDWQWETYPQFLDHLARQRFTLDLGSYLPHGALRVAVMGRRGARHDEVPTPEELRKLTALSREALAAGALGISTSRTVNQRARDGSHTPSYSATLAELMALAEALRESDAGLLQAVADFDDVKQEFELFRKLAAYSGRAVSLAVNQRFDRPDDWRTVLALISQANAEGLAVSAQVAVRPIGVLMGFQTSVQPFMASNTFKSLAGFAHEQKIAKLLDPALREQLCNERPPPGSLAESIAWNFEQVFLLEEPPDFEPSPQKSMAALARQRGCEPIRAAYDAMLADGGRGLLFRPAMNYAGGNLDVCHEMLTHPHTVPGLSDGGAHCATICDASFPTSLLQLWVRERRGKRLPLEYVVKRQAADTAALVGFDDRGRLLPGQRADLNLIDLANVGLRPPAMVYDLPAGGGRLIQSANGYRMTFVAGTCTRENGEFTGALPGKLRRRNGTAIV